MLASPAEAVQEGWRKAPGRFVTPLPIWPFTLLPFGRRSEIGGVTYLRSLGFKILASPFRTKLGEIDIVARDGPILVFVEVKARRSDAPPEDNVGYRKRQRLIRAARAYTSKYKLHDSPYRFDILAVTHHTGQNPIYRLLKDAFQNSNFDL